MTDVQSPMSVHSFRGIPFPVTHRSIRNAHDAVRHVAEYRDGKQIELTSGGNDVYRYSIPASENLLPVQYKLWFSTYYDDFIRAYKDRRPGKLIDAYRGPVTVKPITLMDEASADRRDGPTLDIEFEEHREIGDVELPFDASIHGIVYLSEDIDREMAAVAWDEGNVPEQLTSKRVEWTENEPPEPTINPIDAVTGLVRQGEFLVRRSTAIFQDTARRLNKLEDAIEDLRDPNLYQLQAKSRRTRLQTVKAQQRLESGDRSIRAQPLNEELTVIDAANRYGMTLDEFLDLNPHLAKSMIVPKGAPIRFFKQTA